MLFEHQWLFVNKDLSGMLLPLIPVFLILAFISIHSASSKSPGEIKYGRRATDSPNYGRRASATTNYGRRATDVINYGRRATDIPLNR